MRVLLTVLLVTTAAAVEQDLRVRSDYFQLTESGEGSPGGQQVGYGLRGDVSGLAKFFGGDLELHLDGRAREDLTRPRGSRRHVDELRLRLDEAGPVSVDVGRVPFGEGVALLLVDGAALELAYTDWLTHTVAGGWRADFDDPTPDADRPTAATALAARTEWFDAAASFSWTHDRVGPSGRDGEVQRELFDAALRALVLPADTVWLLATGEVADVAAWAVPVSDPRTWTWTEEGYAITQAYGQVGWRPVRPLKLDAGYLFVASRFGTGGGTERFQDVTARARWRALRDLSLMARGRYRFRDRLVVDGDGYGTEPEAATRAQPGVDVHDVADTGLRASGSAVLDRGDRHGKLAYTAEVGHRGPWWTASIGWRGTVRDPDDSSETYGGANALDPYSRNVRQAAYLRAGTYTGLVDAWASVDQDLESKQTMLFVQVGARWR